MDFSPQLHTYVIFHITIMDMVLLETFVWIQLNAAVISWHCFHCPPADLFTHCAHETGVGESMPCLTSLLICQERDCGVVKWLQCYLVTYFVESNLEV